MGVNIKSSLTQHWINTEQQSTHCISNKMESTTWNQQHGINNMESTTWNQQHGINNMESTMYQH